MARGWESKSVEDQIQARESRSQPSKPKQTPQDVQRRAKLDGLLAARARTLTNLQTVCDRRHRAHLELVLADLDVQIEAIGSNFSRKKMVSDQPRKTIWTCMNAMPSGTIVSDAKRDPRKLRTVSIVVWSIRSIWADT